MAGITFNIILIRAYKGRLRKIDSNADAGDANGEKTLSGLRFPTAHSTTNSTRSGSQAAHRARSIAQNRTVVRGEIEN